MVEGDRLDEVVLELPAEVAYELMEQDAVRPYLRQERVDPELVPAVVLAVTTAVSTVVATKITEGLVGSIVKAVRGWLSRREDDEAPVLRAPGTSETLVIDDHTTDEEIAEFIRNVRDEA